MTEKNLFNLITDDLSIVIAGQAGQGIETMTAVLTKIFKESGYYTFACQEFMSRVRGGTNSATIRVSSKPVKAYVHKIDILMALQASGVSHLQKRISERTVIVGDFEKSPETVKASVEVGDIQQVGSQPSDPPLPPLSTGGAIPHSAVFGFGSASSVLKLSDKQSVYDVPFLKIALELGNPLFVNTIAVGVILALLKIDLEPLNVYLEKQFGRKGQEIVAKNKEAARRGYEEGRVLWQDKTPPFPPLAKGGRFPISANPDLELSSEVENQMLINGSEAVGMGAIAGGCNFVASYPMSPSTAVFSFLCQKAHEFGIVAEQAEDEIAAINFGIGAWYAGARAMTTTSGGGFALMTEGVSLAGMIESPMVIYVAQRPGPATGVPTRTEQGDLELVLHAGHGEFPRIILAPGNVEQAFYLSQKAFNLADKYQCPVFILSDQYLVDAVSLSSAFDMSRCKNEQQIVKTSADYKRYALMENGISPRGIPGFGEGVFCAGSDEHDEEGHNTENLDMHVAMVQKRKKKGEVISQDVIEPELVAFGKEGAGSKTPPFPPLREYSGQALVKGGRFPISTNPDLELSLYEILFIGWGSTYEIIKEALQRINRRDIAFLHFSQVYPLPKSTLDYLKKAKKLVMIENNTNGQLARLIKRELGIEMDEIILHYDGLPMSVEWVMGEVSRVSKYNNSPSCIQEGVRGRY